MLKNLLFFISLILLAAMVLTLVFGQKKPHNLGVRDGRLAPCPDTPNCVSSLSKDPDHRVEPLTVRGDPHDPMAILKELTGSMARTLVVDEAEDYLWVRFSSRFFRFRDDLEFLYDREAGVIQVRSASRLGRYDFGVNRKRVERVREMFSRIEP